MAYGSCRAAQTVAETQNKHINITIHSAFPLIFFTCRRSRRHLRMGSSPSPAVQQESERGAWGPGRVTHGVAEVVVAAGGRRRASCLGSARDCLLRVRNADKRRDRRSNKQRQRQRHCYLFSDDETKNVFFCWVFTALLAAQCLACIVPSVWLAPRGPLSPYVLCASFCVAWCTVHQCVGLLSLASFFPSPFLSLFALLPRPVSQGACLCHGSRCLCRPQVARHVPRAAVMRLAVPRASFHACRRLGRCTI